ncbi:MAG: metallophosphoesterase [Cyanobacteria bacterium SZAS LIN-2]|nr:metallophosphoesterase [Cyanobacteria bacterium SZAS LIN-3]MBS1996271.1 metallophosphoesterase [Cyanobacteria bacterium SZAS LIN-2]
MTIIISTLLVLALAAFGVRFKIVRRRRKRSDRPDEAVTVIHSGKDASWHAPVFESAVSSPFFIKPWLQAGDAPHFAAPGQGESLEVVWHTVDDSKAFHVEVSPAGSTLQGPLPPDTERPVFTPVKTDIAVSGVVRQVQYRAKLTGLTPGEQFDYAVFADGVPVFRATARARPPQGAGFKALIFGDMGNGSKWQKLIAHQMAQQNKRGAELVISTGDVVYQNGRYSEYLSKFFAVYQPQKEGPDHGATLFDDTVVLSCGGNHDFGWLDTETLIGFDEYPDVMAFYQLWSLPLNGPDSTTLGANSPPLRGNPSAVRAMLAAAGERYPRMANYSYDYGAAHFLVLDANTYMDWTNAALRQWVEDDLKAVAPGQWKIVVFHQPGFTSNINHQSEQRMRFLADIFERNGVDVVFNGHAHLYDRSRPLKFAVAGGIKPEAMDKDGYVAGQFVYDTKFDGVTNTVPDGVLYIVTGGGGAKLDSRELEGQPSLWQPSTAKLLGDRHSFTLADFSPEALRLTQIDYEGKTVDSFVITRKSAGA